MRIRLCGAPRQVRASVLRFLRLRLSVQSVLRTLQNHLSLLLLPRTEGLTSENRPTDELTHSQPNLTNRVLFLQKKKTHWRKRVRRQEARNFHDGQESALAACDRRRARRRRCSQ